MKSFMSIGIGLREKKKNMDKMGKIFFAQYSAVKSLKVEMT